MRVNKATIYMTILLATMGLLTADYFDVIPLSPLVEVSGYLVVGYCVLGLIFRGRN